MLGMLVATRVLLLLVLGESKHVFTLIPLILVNTAELFWSSPFLVCSVEA